MLNKMSKYTFAAVIVVLIITSLIISLLVPKGGQYSDDYKEISSMVKAHSDMTAKQKIEAYAAENGLTMNDYPEDMIALLERNPETEKFVLEYPFEKDKKHTVNIRQYNNAETVPLFMQWDKAWGYNQYGDDIIAINGCGPVCLSMAAVYVLQDTKYSPDYVADFAVKNGYQCEGAGSLWTLISEGGEKLGMDVTEIPLDENRIIHNLEVHNPIICIMGPGDFTSKGHFIVLTGYEDGKITVNDPNSYANSDKKWSYDEIKDQIQNLWVLRES